MYSSVGDEDARGFHSLSVAHMKALEISSTEALQKLSLNNSAKTQNTAITQNFQMCTTL